MPVLYACWCESGRISWRSRPRNRLLGPYITMLVRPSVQLGRKLILPLRLRCHPAHRIKSHYPTFAMSTTSVQNELKYLLVLDFEATCGDAVPYNEIIEFPTLVYNLKEDKVEATFHEYVRPVDFPTLTKFCTDLTGITQDVVDAAVPFPVVWTRFQAFMKERGLLDDPQSHVFVTCGNWDLRTMLPKQLQLCPNEYGLDGAGNLVAPYNNLINIKDAFQKHYKMRHAKGMAGMLGKLKLPLEGRHHSGIDDCRNILRIVQTMLKGGWKPVVK